MFVTCTMPSNLSFGDGHFDVFCPDRVSITSGFSIAPSRRVGNNDATAMPMLVIYTPEDTSTSASTGTRLAISVCKSTACPGAAVDMASA